MSRIGVPRTWRGAPVWLAGVDAGDSKQQSCPSLRGRTAADVVVVGGGMTGALVAQTFAEAGVSVAVLEGALVGRGSTAASSALLLQEPDHGIGELARRYGSRTAVRVWQLSHDAVRDLIRLLRRLRIDCNLTQRDAVFYAPNREGLRGLRREYRRRTRAAFPAEWLNSRAVRRLTGINAAGAIRTSGNAQFDPFQACVGVIAAARRDGARVFERSAVTGVEQRRGGVLVRTRDGSIEAAGIVVATGYATETFRPLAERFRMYHTYVLATPRLDARQRRSLGLSRLMIWDTQRPYHYARWTPDGRLLLGGGDRRVRGRARDDARFAAATQSLYADFCALFPGLADVGVERAWEGLFAMTPDSLPYIGAHRRYPRHLFALGYGGNGMTFAYLAARMLREQWLGERSPDHELFRFGRLR